VLAAAGIATNSEVDIQANDGRVVIQLHELTQEQAFDKLLANEPDAAELLALVQASLTKAIDRTDKTTERCYSLIEKLEQRNLV
jgi:alpha-D-ribose 1-methylphosphonate 5-triphosphate synthase subunit PhnG